MARDRKRAVKYLPLIVLLFIASTLIFSVTLIPIMTAKLQMNAELVIIALLIVVSTIASLVGMLVYIILSKK
jgi:hypothetical protein